MTRLHATHRSLMTALISGTLLSGCTNGPVQTLDYHPNDKDLSANADTYGARQIEISQLLSFQQRIGEWNRQYHVQLDALHREHIRQVHLRALRLHALRDNQTLPLEQHNVLQALAYQANEPRDVMLTRYPRLTKQFLALEIRQLANQLAWAETASEQERLAQQLLAIHDGDYPQHLRDVILGFSPDIGRPTPPELTYPAVPPEEAINGSVDMVKLSEDYESMMVARSLYLEEMTDYLRQPLAHSPFNPEPEFRTYVLEYELQQAGVSQQDFFKWAGHHVEHTPETHAPEAAPEVAQ